MKPGFLFLSLLWLEGERVLIHSASLLSLSIFCSFVLRASSNFKKMGKEVANVLLISLYHVEEAELRPENESAFLIFSFGIHFSRVSLLCWETSLS